MRGSHYLGGVIICCYTGVKRAIRYWVNGINFRHKLSRISQFFGKYSKCFQILFITRDCDLHFRKFRKFPYRHHPKKHEEKAEQAKVGMNIHRLVWGVYWEGGGVYIFFPAAHLFLPAFTAFSFVIFFLQYSLFPIWRHFKKITRKHMYKWWIYWLYCRR